MCVESERVTVVCSSNNSVAALGAVPYSILATETLGFQWCIYTVRGFSDVARITVYNSMVRSFVLGGCLLLGIQNAGWLWGHAH